MTDEERPPIVAAGGWSVLQTETVLESRWLTVRREHIRTSGGVEVPEYYLVDAPDIVVVLALTEAGQTILVEQYRHGIGSPALELPAGMLDVAGESPRAGALRELEEETGHRARTIEALGELRPSNARQTNRCFCYLALDCRLTSEPHGDPVEQITVHLATLPEVVRLARAGELGSLVSIGGLFLGLERLRELGRL